LDKIHLSLYIVEETLDCCMQDSDKSDEEPVAPVTTKSKKGPSRSTYVNLKEKE